MQIAELWSEYVVLLNACFGAKFENVNDSQLAVGSNYVLTWTWICQGPISVWFFFFLGPASGSSS